MSDMLQEINEIPGILERIAEILAKGSGIEDLGKRMMKARRVLFTGMGSSVIAPVSIRSRLDGAGIRSTFIDSGEWFYYGRPADSEDLVIAVSQSGESVEVLNLLEHGFLGSDYIAITNDARSRLASKSAAVLELSAGSELGVSTKTYTATLAVLYLLASALRGSAGVQSAAEDLRLCAEALRGFEDDSVRESVEIVRSARSLVFVGRGGAYACAAQCALTFMEGARIISAAFTGGAFRHGPMEMIDRTSTAVLFRVDDPTAPLMDKLATDLSDLGANVVIFTETESALPRRICGVRVPRVESVNSGMLYPLLSSFVHEKLLYYTALSLDIVPGHFRYGNKITAVE